MLEKIKRFISLLIARIIAFRNDGVRLEPSFQCPACQKTVSFNMLGAGDVLETKCNQCERRVVIRKLIKSADLLQIARFVTDPVDEVALMSILNRWVLLDDMEQGGFDRQK